MRDVGWKNLLSGSKLLPGASLKVLRTAQRARQVKDVGGLEMRVVTCIRPMMVPPRCMLARIVPGEGGCGGGGGLTL